MSCTGNDDVPRATGNFGNYVVLASLTGPIARNCNLTPAVATCQFQLRILSFHPTPAPPFSFTRSPPLPRSFSRAPSPADPQLDRDVKTVGAICFRCDGGNDRYVRCDARNVVSGDFSFWKSFPFREKNHCGLNPAPTLHTREREGKGDNYIIL